MYSIISVHEEVVESSQKGENGKFDIGQRRAVGLPYRSFVRSHEVVHVMGLVIAFTLVNLGVWGCLTARSHPMERRRRVRRCRRTTRAIWTAYPDSAPGRLR